MAAPDPRHHPGWFGAVMGTGALALAFATEATTWDWPLMLTLAKTTLVLASLLAIVLLPRYARRLGERSALREEIAHPGHGALLATLPAGLLVLAAGWGRIGPAMIPSTAALWVDGVLLVTGTVLALAVGWAWGSHMMRAAPGLDAVNGGWLIPPVMNLIVPLGLAPLIVANPDAASGLLLVGFAFYGVGLILFLALLALLLARLALRGPLAPPLAPSLWIPLAPAGVLGLALMRLEQAGSEAGVPGFSGVTTGVVVAAMGLGFGLWWAGFAAIELRRIHVDSGVPLHPGWWGFVFPVAAMTLSLATVGAATAVTAIEVAGLVATFGLTALWAYVGLRTFGLSRRNDKERTQA